MKILQIKLVHGVFLFEFLFQYNQWSLQTVVILYHDIMIQLDAYIFDCFWIILPILWSFESDERGVACIYMEHIAVDGFSSPFH